MDDDPSPRPSARRARATARPPALEVRVSSEVGRLPLGRERVAVLAREVLRGERCASAVLAVTFVSPATIARLNRQHLGHRGPTDIITFEHAATAPGLPVVGDIYIAPAIAAASARRFGATAREEVARLVIHGVLHALGWEHPEGEGSDRTRSAMWRRQERWLSRLREAGRW